MEKTVVTAVLDVGKTNKKVLLYDREFNLVDDRRINLDAEPGDDGIEYEQTGPLFDWVCSSLNDLSRDFSICSLSITTHGATLAVLDGDGRLVHPVLSYLSPAGERVENEFNERFGPPEEIHAETCTPPFGFANAAKQLFFLKKFFPNDWEKAETLLFFPQYLGFLFTGQTAADPTYLGCHTYLWLPEKNGPSTIARELGADRMLPTRIASPWEKLGVISPEIAERCGLGKNVPVTIGIHDSNASLLPYLAKDFGSFTLNSTGTWCVAMTPSSGFDFEEDELGTKTFYNLSAFGQPVKTSIFPGGLERSEFAGLVDQVAGGGWSAVVKLCRDRDLFLAGGMVPGAKAFPHSEPAAILASGRRIPLEELRTNGIRAAEIDAGEFIAALDLSLAIQSVEALNRAGRRPGTDIFVEGGFAHNDAYCRTLAALLPENRVCRTKLREATAFGAAVCGWMLADGTPLEELGGRFDISVSPVEQAPPEGLTEYDTLYRRHCSAA